MTELTLYKSVSRMLNGISTWSEGTFSESDMIEMPTKAPREQGRNIEDPDVVRSFYYGASQELRIDGIEEERMQRSLSFRRQEAWTASTLMSQARVSRQKRVSINHIDLPPLPLSKGIQQRRSRPHLLMSPSFATSDTQMPLRR